MNIRPEDLRALLEQHWLHCRHLENERAAFMGVYAILTGGMLASMAQEGFKFKDEALWPLCFLERLQYLDSFTQCGGFTHLNITDKEQIVLLRKYSKTKQSSLNWI